MKTVANKPKKLHVKSGDTVKVISGNSKGQTGKILRVLVDKQRATVEGVNIITKHIKPSAANPQGSIEKTEGTIHISNLMVVDPATGEASRTGRKLNDKNKLQRFSKKSGNLI
jgi:large subunit ribosomal protein L24